MHDVEIIERIAQILMLRDAAPFPRVWSGEPQQGKEVDNRGVEWTTTTPVCSDKERRKWREEAAKFLVQLRKARLDVGRCAPAKPADGAT